MAELSRVFRQRSLLISAPRTMAFLMRERSFQPHRSRTRLPWRIHRSPRVPRMRRMRRMPRMSRSARLKGPKLGTTAGAPRSSPTGSRRSMDPPRNGRKVPEPHRPHRPHRPLHRWLRDRAGPMARRLGRVTNTETSGTARARVLRTTEMKSTARATAVTTAIKVRLIAHLPVGSPITAITVEAVGGTTGHPCPMAMSLINA
mmetsp:Transcript_5182/g.11905  ORF Transcript_5182/g.11905 Transcript_5182/m.11905 type:complete len:202 (-) Transcript_5182:1072-1677(-)